MSRFSFHILLTEYVYIFSLALFQTLQRVMDIESKSDPFNGTVSGFESSCLLLEVYTLPSDFNLCSHGQVVHFCLHPLPKIATYQPRFTYKYMSKNKKGYVIFCFLSYLVGCCVVMMGKVITKPGTV
jgi:hypothetical protein